MIKTETKRRSSGRVTLSDVAKAAGVSPITASRALRGERGVAQELVQRVKDAAQQLGYVPDPAAARLPGGHPEGLIRAFANIYRGGFKAIRGEENRPGWDYPCSFQGAVTLAFVEAVLRSAASESWTDVVRVE